MQVSKVSLMRRRNLGNYEHIEAGVEVALVEGECTDEALVLAKETLAKALGMKSKAPATESPSKKEEVATPKKEEAVKEEKPKKEKKTKAKKEKSTPEVTKEEVVAALRDYAQAKKSKEMAVAVMKDCTGVEALGDVDPKDYKKLVKALKV